jgi:hypothetical protein
MAGLVSSGLGCRERTIEQVSSPAMLHLDSDRLHIWSSVDKLALEPAVNDYLASILLCAPKANSKSSAGRQIVAAGHTTIVQA